MERVGRKSMLMDLLLTQWRFPNSAAHAFMRVGAGPIADARADRVGRDRAGGLNLAQQIAISSVR
jgi:hypothetical protein